MEIDRTEHYSKLLVLGIGNLLMGDEGVGVHLAQELASVPSPQGVTVLDGGTGGFHLMEYFTAYRCIVLIDATLDGRPPGTIRLLTPRFSAEFPRSMSTHDIGLRDLLEGLQVLGTFPKVYLFAVSVASLQEMHLGLSPEVQAAMPELKAQVRMLCGQLTGVIPPDPAPNGTLPFQKNPDSVRKNLASPAGLPK